MFSLGRHRSCVQSSPGLVPVCHHADLKWPVDRLLPALSPQVWGQREQETGVPTILNTGTQNLAG